jgi:lipopolysaccharide/colanic/teichoic acid biosynthesis glycosyltransferase
MQLTSRPHPATLVTAIRADAARRKLRAEGLLGVVQVWEKEHGELSDVELKAVTRKQPRRQRK